MANFVGPMHYVENMFKMTTTATGAERRAGAKKRDSFEGVIFETLMFVNFLHTAHMHSI